MSINNIHVTELVLVRADYYTSAEATVDITYSRTCPLGHIIGDKTHTIDLLCRFFNRDQPITHNLESLCPECGVRFGLGLSDMKKIISAIPKIDTTGGKL